MEIERSHNARNEKAITYLAPNPPITIILFKYVKKISNFKTEYEKSDYCNQGECYEAQFAHLTAQPWTGESSSSVPSYITFVRTLKATGFAYAFSMAMTACCSLGGPVLTGSPLTTGSGC